jgi:uroporphyrinogen decarboxylase
MNSKQRILAAMNHETPDRVPVMCQLALGHYFLNCDYGPSDIWFDSQTFAGALVELMKKYGFDGTLLNLPGRSPEWKDRLQSYEKNDDGELLCWKSGLETVVPSNDNPHTYQKGRTPLQRADYNKIDITDPATYRINGYLWNIWHVPELWDIDPQADLADPAVYPNWFTSGVRKVQQFAPDASVHCEIFSPFTHLLELFGYEQALFALIENPQTCRQLLDVFTRQMLAQIKVYAECKPDAILISSAFAGAGFISRQMYLEFVLPYEKQLCRAIADYGCKSYVHTCGAIGDRLDLMIQTELNGIDTLDPPPLGTVNLEEAKAKYGDRIFFKGNLDAVNEMLNADDETFEEAVKGRLRIGMPGSGYILSSACSVAPHVRPQRLHELVKLAKEYGRYNDNIIA